MNRTALLALIGCLGCFGCSSSSSDTDPTPGTGENDAAPDQTGDDGTTDGPGVSDAATEKTDAPVDDDGDGYASDIDCNDDDPDIHPGAAELCNGKDDDCSGQSDEGETSDGVTFHEDADHDGLGSSSKSQKACSAPSGYVSNDLDCDDSNAAVGAKTTWYADADGDGSGNLAKTQQACAQPTGYVADAEDCNDSDPAVHPGLTYHADQDGDGFGDPASSMPGCLPPAGFVSNGLDCNDSDPAVRPMVQDDPDPNGIDTNCDLIDGDASKAIFVSSGGVDSNDGKAAVVVENGVLKLKVNAVRTLAKALELADTEDPKRYVLVAEGNYDQSETSLALREGVSIHGGYAADWLSRNLTHDAVVISSTWGASASTSAATMTADSLTKPVTLDRVTVRGPDLSACMTPGVASVALRVSATGSAHVLVLSDVGIEGGTGAPGQVGTDQPDATTGACTCKGSEGGAGGTPAANSGNGAESVYVNCGPNILTGAYGGSGRVQCYCGVGGPFDYEAADGDDGGTHRTCTAAAAGGAAPAANAGSFTGTQWVPPGASGAGATGANGSGGIGGGGGGAYQWCCDVAPSQTVSLNGGAGGKGGDGGCGGTGGTGGKAGGASLGLALLNSTADLNDVSIVLGVGGVGGRGGAGGNGLAGTQGLNGSPGQTGGTNVNFGVTTKMMSMRAGDGGRGGFGGHGCGGGGGGGGQGGWAIGLATSGNLTIVTDLVTFSDEHAAFGAGGVGGLGGMSGSGDVISTTGSKGADGQLQHTWAF